MLPGNRLWCFLYCSVSNCSPLVCTGLVEGSCYSKFIRDEWKVILNLLLTVEEICLWWDWPYSTCKIPSPLNQVKSRISNVVTWSKKAKVRLRKAAPQFESRPSCMEGKFFRLRLLLFLYLNKLSVSQISITTMNQAAPNERIGHLALYRYWVLNYLWCFEMHSSMYRALNIINTKLHVIAASFWCKRCNTGSSRRLLSLIIDK